MRHARLLNQLLCVPDLSVDGLTAQDLADADLCDTVHGKISIRFIYESVRRAAEILRPRQVLGRLTALWAFGTDRC